MEIPSKEDFIQRREDLAEGGTKLNDRDRLLMLLQTKALEVRSVVLSSGRTSDYYIDCKRVTLTPEGAYLTAKLMLEKIQPDASAIGGLTLGADPIVASISVLSYIQGRNLPALIVRKEPKKHGTKSFIEGPKLEKGSRIAVVEDVVTTGGSILLAIERIATEGYQPVQALSILDRLEGGRETLEIRGFKLESLYTKNDLKINK
jgi:orotate phosphoribosyltransferase